jgi:outer membrane biosynthesis protein TonB
MNRLQRSAQSLGILAAALLLGSSTTLPVLAAMSQRQPTGLPNRLSGEAVPLLASSDSDSDSDKEKKKKKKKQQDQQRQPKQQPQSTPANKQEHKGKSQKDSDRQLNAPTKNSNKKSDTKKKAGSQKHSTGDNKQRPSKSKASDEQRQEFYQKGREDGLKKGREKGYDKGYEAGKKKGKDEAYHKARRGNPGTAISGGVTTGLAAISGSDPLHTIDHFMAIPPGHKIPIGATTDLGIMAGIHPQTQAGAGGVGRPWAGASTLSPQP